jgi:hypothetical protein
VSAPLLCFASTFVAVFALGLQSQNVNQGHYWAAAGTSLLIGAGHIALYKFMPGAELAEVLGYLAGGVTGITASMWFHRSVKAWWKRRAEVARIEAEKEINHITGPGIESTAARYRPKRPRLAPAAATSTRRSTPRPIPTEKAAPPPSRQERKP